MDGRRLLELLENSTPILRPNQAALRCAVDRPLRSFAPMPPPDPPAGRVVGSRSAHLEAATEVIMTPSSRNVLRRCLCCAAATAAGPSFTQRRSVPRGAANVPVGTPTGDSPLPAP